MGGLIGEFHLVGAGALSDTLTYFTQVTITQDGNSPISGDIETAYLLWNDIVGPDHAVNLWLGRLFAPQLTSFGMHSDYLSDGRLPGSPSSASTTIARSRSGSAGTTSTPTASSSMALSSTASITR